MIRRELKYGIIEHFLSEWFRESVLDLKGIGNTNFFKHGFYKILNLPIYYILELETRYFHENCI